MCNVQLHVILVLIQPVLRYMCNVHVILYSTHIACFTVYVHCAMCVLFQYTYRLLNGKCAMCNHMLFWYLSGRFHGICAMCMLFQYTYSLFYGRCALCNMCVILVYIQPVLRYICNLHVILVHIQPVLRYSQPRESCLARLSESAQMNIAQPYIHYTFIISTFIAIAMSIFMVDYCFHCCSTRTKTVVYNALTVACPVQHTN